jgi:hypothetical protein
MNLLGRLNATYLLKGVIMGKLEEKVAVITGGSSGMALASAKLFVEERAPTFSSRVGSRSSSMRPSN